MLAGQLLDDYSRLIKLTRPEIIPYPSEAEMKNRKEAIEDAISSTKAAIAEGVVPGGGFALLRTIIQDGMIVESGTHTELLARGDLYAHLYEVQFHQEVAEPQSQEVSI